MIILSYGTVTNSQGYAASTSSRTGAIGYGVGSTRTYDNTQRIYYNSLGESTLYESKIRGNRYAVITRMSDGQLIKRLRFTSIDKAQKYIDAMEFIKNYYAK